MKSLESAKQTYDQFSDKHPYVASIAETALLYGVKTALIKGGDRIGIPLGHGRRNDPKREAFINQHPLAAAGLSSVVAPISEELVYRELPDRILKSKGYEADSTMSRRVKLGVVAVFGASPQHLGKDAIPIPQMLGGLNYNRIHRERGLKASTVAHITNNALGALHYAVKKRSKK